jgi:hypothetical protein
MDSILNLFYVNYLHTKYCPSETYLRNSKLWSILDNTGLDWIYQLGTKLFLMYSLWKDLTQVASTEIYSTGDPPNLIQCTILSYRVRTWPFFSIQPCLRVEMKYIKYGWGLCQFI